MECPAHCEWRIEKRSLTSGALITTFGTNGFITESYGGNDQAWGVAVDATGMYVVGYDDYPGTHAEMRIEKRSLTTGDFITTFGTNGAISEDFPSGTSVAGKVAVDATGIYIAGYDQNTVGNKNEWRVEKRNLTTGDIIWGKSEHISSGSDSANDVAVDSSGVYYVGVDQNTVGNVYEMRVEKRNLTTGDILWAQSEHFSAGEWLSGVAVDSSGVYVVGYDENTVGNKLEWRVEERSLTTGAIVWAQSEHVSSNNDQAMAIAVDNSAIYVAGADQNTFDKDYECMLEKRNLGVALTVTPQTPLNGTLIDSTYQTLTVKLTTPPAKPTAWPNVTIYVNNTAICTNQTAPATGLVSCHYQVTLPGRYMWNGTAQYGAVAPQPTFAFTAGMIEPISLVAGWNLISLPIVPGSSMISKVLAAQIAANDFSIVWSYQNGKWSSAILSNGKLSGPLTTMQDGLGYWIYMTKADTLYLTGYIIPPASAPPSYTLAPGWNLVGFKPQPTIQSEKVGDYLYSITSRYDLNSVWVYDGSSSTWTRADSNYMLEPGQAMWVLITAPATLRP